MENQTQEPIRHPKDMETLEVMAKLTNSKLEIKDIITDWILVTYDIPHTPEGDKLRREFLIQGKLIGMTMHTESVYFMPHTPLAETLALKLARGGQAIVWTSQTTSEGVARQLTHKYDKGIDAIIKEIEDRIDRQWAHIQAKRFKQAERMSEKTNRLLSGLEQASERRGNAAHLALVSLLRARFINL